MSTTSLLSTFQHARRLRRSPLGIALSVLALALAFFPARAHAAATTVVQIDPGVSHACALTSAGGVVCWGENLYGQLGDGSTTTRVTPVAVSGLASGVRSVSSYGVNYSCAVTNAGAAVCWGGNFTGQLGDGTTVTRLTPVGVVGLGSGVVEVSTGKFYSCAVTTEGAALCWGDNKSGQLGSEGGFSTTPVAVSDLSSGVVAISASSQHTCALTSAGGVLCWGDNIGGQLGNGTTISSVTPVPVSGLSSGVAAISTGDSHTCALTDAGAVLCWGRNLDGEIGDGSTVARLTPTPVSGLSSGVTAISAGASHTCAITSAGAVLCWGENIFGQLGDGTETNRPTPVAVSGLDSGVAAITAGSLSSCAVTSAGAALCWGNNSNGLLGDGSGTPQLTPVAVQFATAPTVAMTQSSQCLASNGAQLALAVGDADTPTENLSLSATSSDATVLPPGNITLGGTGGARTLAFSVVAGVRGSSTLSIKVSDGTSTTALNLKVRVGNGGNNTLKGGSGPDILLGNGGDDTLYGYGGDDLLCGGSGNDQLFGGDGDDTLRGGSGDDLITGGSGADRFNGGDGTDRFPDFDAGQGDTRD